MDAAVATLNNARAHSRDIMNIGTVTGMDDATLGMEVEKSGRTTGLTKGIVDGVSMSVSINYGDPGVVAFTNQIRIVPRPPWPAVDVEISLGGDSGSIWLNERTNRADWLALWGRTEPLTGIGRKRAGQPDQACRVSHELLVPADLLPGTADPHQTHFQHLRTLSRDLRVADPAAHPHFQPAAPASRSKAVQRSQAAPTVA